MGIPSLKLRVSRFLFLFLFVVETVFKPLSQKRKKLFQISNRLRAQGLGICALSGGPDLSVSVVDKILQREYRVSQGKSE